MKIKIENRPRTNFQIWAFNFRVIIVLFLFYNNLFDKNIETEIGENFENMFRIYLTLWLC